MMLTVVGLCLRDGRRKRKKKGRKKEEKRAMRSLSFDDPIRFASLFPSTSSFTGRRRLASQLPRNSNPPTAGRSAAQAHRQGKKREKKKSNGQTVSNCPTVQDSNYQDRLADDWPPAASFANITEGSVEYLVVFPVRCSNLEDGYAA